MKKIIILTILVLMTMAGCTQFDVNKSKLQHSITQEKSSKPSETALKMSTPEITPNASVTQSANITQESEDQIELFFASRKKDPEVMSPEKTYPVKTAVHSGKDEEIVKAALEKLLKGPSESEKKEGYYTTIPEGTKINSVKIDKDNIAIDFNSSLNEGGGSCDMAQRRSQIENTVKSISTIKDKKIIISVDGDDEKVLQP